MKIALSIIFTVLSYFANAQDTLVLKGNDFKVGENKVAELKKKKKGLLGIPKFYLQNAAEKDLIFIEQVIPGSTGPEKLPTLWYVFNNIETKDSFLVSKAGLDAYEKQKLFGSPTDVLAKVIYDNKILKLDGTLDEAAFAATKQKHPETYGAIDANNIIKQNTCRTLIPVLLKRDVTKPVEVTEVSKIFTEEKKYAEIVYEVKQDGIVLGKIVAKGNLNGAKAEDSEYDFSPGILDLDFKSAPLDYQFYNTTDCVVANYYSQEVLLITAKDALQTKRGAVVKGNSAYTNRLTFIKAMCEFMVKKGYY